MVARRLTAEQIKALADSGREDLLRAYHAAITHPLNSFQPRPDRPEDFDEQTAFVESDAKFAVCLGGTGCLASEQPVFVLGSGMVPVEEIGAPFVTLSWSEHGPCLALANRPFVKGVADLFRYILSDGRQFLATASHLVLSARGCWVSAERAFVERTLLRTCESESEFLENAFCLPVALPRTQSCGQSEQDSSFDRDALIESSHSRASQSDASEFVRPCSCSLVQSFDAHFRSTADTDQLACLQGAGRWFHKQEGSQGDCLPDRRLCDGRLQLASSGGQALALLQVDARGYNRCGLRQGDRACELRYSQICRLPSRLSMMGFSLQDTNQLDAFESHAYCRPSTRAWGFCQVSLQFESLKGRRVHTTSASFRPATQLHSMLPYSDSVGGNLGGTAYIVAMEFVKQDVFYDFTVHETHCYVTSGVVHHNSGKTAAAAYKTARYVLDTPPPRPRCAYWIIGDTFEQVCAACWDEKLSALIPKDRIKHIDWYRPNRNWPYAVTLRDPRDPDKPGWCIEFKSYSQGRAHMQARSIGGAWFNEECPFEIVEEVMGRCRDYDSPIWADFTPIEVRSAEWPEFYENPPEGWRFFHLNTELNDALAPGWAERYLSTVPEDMRDTRRIGTFASYSGQVFKEWRPTIHVIDEFPIPHDWRRIRGIDFGFNNPFCCLWIARDRDGRYFVYDEHYEARKLNADHAKAIKRRHWDYNSPYYGPTYSDHDAQQRAELGQLEIHCTPANKNSVARRIALLRSLMMIQGDGRPRLYVFRRCKNLIKEFRLYKWPTASGGDNARNPADLPVDKDNHALDSLGYGIYTDHNGVATAPQPAKRDWQPRKGVQFSR